MKKHLLLILVASAIVLSGIPGAMAADSTSLASPSVLGTDIEKGSGGGVPVGTVITWPVGSNPEDAENWLECNGQAISQSAYPELFAVVGGMVPNYQGMFLRGYGSQSHTQNNGSTVGNTSTAHESGALGAVQGDAIRNITGSARPIQGAASPAGFPNTSGPFTSSTDSDKAAGSYGGARFGTLRIDLSRATPTAPEIRPVNMAVRYLIRANP